MAMNPMQRKSRISFLLGMLLTLVIAGVAIVFLMNQIRETNEEMAVYESATISVLNQDVKSGQIITADMLVPMRVHPNMVPNNTDGVEALFENDYMVDQNGKRILGNVETGLYYEDEEGSTNMTSITKGNDGKYYAKNGTTTTEVKIYGTPIIAKIDIGANTPLTTDMLARTDNVVSADVRLKEYNMIDLPATLAEGEFIDIRLTLPSGQDYIVISKKEVKQCDLTTVWIEVTEDEMLTMSNAIIESYIMTGSQLHATRYVEPGLQQASTTTYPISPSINDLLKSDPNISADKINAIQSGINAAQRQAIESEISKYAADKKDNIETGVEESSLKALESRTEYIGQL